MRRLLRIASVVLAGAVAGAWAASGMNTGWTKNRVPTKEPDEITGLNQTVWIEMWVPGVDFLAAGLAFSAVLSIAARPRKTEQPKEDNL